MIAIAEIAKQFKSYHDYFIEHIFNNTFINLDGQMLKVYISNGTNTYGQIYSDKFWHLASYEVKERYNVFPCFRTPSYNNCQLKCDEETQNLLFDRVPCLFRADQLSLFNVTINSFNKRSPLVKCWFQDSRKASNKQNLVIFYENGIDNYEIIISLRKNKEDKYVFAELASAYPVTLRSRIKSNHKNYKKFGINFK